MKFSFRLVEHGNETILGIADKDILGKTFSDKQLKITISKDFYYQDYCTAEDALKMIKKAAMVNAFGKNIIKVMIENNIISEENVLRPCGVPHSQVFNLC